MTIAVAHHSFTMNGEAVAAGPRLILRPNQFFLDADDSRIIHAEIDLSCFGTTKGTLETSIDVLMNQALTLKLWVEIDIYERS
jgi:hypothetical protein